MVASLNVRTLQESWLGARRRTALITYELARYNIDIAALNETRLPYEGSLVEVGTGNTFSAVAYQQLPVTFIAFDFQLNCAFTEHPRIPHGNR